MNKLIEEPVAWQFFSGGEWFQCSKPVFETVRDAGIYACRELYAAPQPAEPLADFVARQKPMPPDIQQALSGDMTDLYARGPVEPTSGAELNDDELLAIARKAKEDAVKFVDEAQARSADHNGYELEFRIRFGRAAIAAALAKRGVK